MNSSAFASGSSSSSSRNASASVPQGGLSELLAHISNLPLGELNTHLSNRRQTAIPGQPLSDEELSLSLFAAEAEGLLNVAKDHATGVGGPGEDALYDALHEMEQTAQYDRMMAIALSEGRDPPPRPPAPTRGRARDETRVSLRFGYAPSEGTVPEPREVNIQDPSSSPTTATEPAPRSPSLGFPTELWSSIASTNLTLSPPDAPSDDEDDDEGSFEPSRPASPDLEYATMRNPSHSFPSCLSGSPGPSESVAPSVIALSDPQCICIVCLNRIDDGPVVSAACGHPLDVGCLRALFENATRDASLFPPRCCPLGALELDDAAETHLGPALASRYRQKAVEYRTKDPVYCSNPRCSVFLRGACAAATALPCPECSTVTCGACKRGAHPGETCESSRADEALLELAKARRWTRCPSCHAVVERTEGCRHIVCRCRAEFCYLCAAVWTKDHERGCR